MILSALNRFCTVNTHFVRAGNARHQRAPGCRILTSSWPGMSHVAAPGCRLGRAPGQSAFFSERHRMRIFLFHNHLHTLTAHIFPSSRFLIDEPASGQRGRGLGEYGFAEYGSEISDGNAAARRVGAGGRWSQCKRGTCRVGTVFSVSARSAIDTFGTIGTPAKCQKCQTPLGLALAPAHRNGTPGRGRGHVDRMREISLSPSGFLGIIPPCIIKSKER